MSVKGCYKCNGRKSCQICGLIKEGDSFENSDENRSFTIFSGRYKVFHRTAQDGGVQSRYSELRSFGLYFGYLKVFFVKLLVLLLKCKFSQLMIYFNEDMNLLPNQYD